MADTYLPKHFTSGADCDVEAEEELNYKLIKLLSTLKTPSQSIPIDYQKTRSLSGTNSDNDTESLLDSASLPGSLDQRRHPYDYSYIHHGSPITSKHLPNFLPPIGVFWDIENCQVGIFPLSITFTLNLHLNCLFINNIFLYVKL